MDEAFWETVDFAKEILDRRIKQIRAERDAYDIVCQRVDQCQNGILYLEHMIPWKDALREHDKDIYYVIYPSMRGGYNIQAIPDRNDKNVLKYPFPQRWRGASPKELQDITGIHDLTFCHMSGFLSAAETLEGAYSVARLAMKTD